jgi:alkylation response protein AidB-like acyl-CoA dehydrogenase
MAFSQDPPRLHVHPYDGDPILKGLLRRLLPEKTLRDLEPGLREMGDLAAGPLLSLLESDRAALPVLTSWDAWGNRVDRITLTPLWRDAQRIAIEKGLVATAYERAHGAHSRLHQMALVYLFDPSTAVYTCPLAMTDGAAKTISLSGNKPLQERALPRLTSRDPQTAWTSGQWMTERTGGSDVGISETVARLDAQGWRLWGTKWFTSATTSQMALTLARPDGNPAGGKGLALFYLELADESGRPNGVTIHRLKDKLGTRMVPTAELELSGARAVPVKTLTDGVKSITTMLNVTRMWNSVCAAAQMRRAVELARDYARRRVAFGTPLSKKTLHLETLADLETISAAAFHLAFRVVTLVGREEAGTMSADEAACLRLLTPLAKLTTGKQAVAVASEALEAFGGAGYVEDTGLPQLLRDAQVLPLWEGTTNVLALDLLRGLSKTGGLAPFEKEIERALAAAIGFDDVAYAVRGALRHAERWLAKASAEGIERLEAGARRFALTLGLCAETALLAEQAAWDAARNEPRTALAARRMVRMGLDRVLDDAPAEEARELALGL